MKHVRRTKQPAEEHSDDAKANEETHVPNDENKILDLEPDSNKSDELKLKVFIADDSTGIRKRLKEMLTENESISLIGESGDAAQSITAIRHLKPDAVILDIRMPGGGGMRVLKDIKMTNPGPIAIVLTAFSYPEYRRAYMAAGADYFFNKTDDVQNMTDVLAELAQKHLMDGNVEK